MRYEDWDILVFPRDCKVPVKEFKTACHVVHDPEFSHGHGSFGLPTVCCFVPSLAPGTPFQISIHSWSTPQISHFTRSYSKYPSNVKFEARLLIDGRMVSSTTLDRKSTWPHVIAHSFDFSKNGDLEHLTFPPFRSELLQQSYWSPADDLGRIKIVISEGFPRDSLSMPIERVKNIVAFSFQHAPLDILESSSIAWPNPSMWRRASINTSMPVPSHITGDIEAHAHSPRRRFGPGTEGLPGHPLTMTHESVPRPIPNRAPMQRMMAQAHPQYFAGNTEHGEMDPFGGASVPNSQWLGPAGAGFGTNAQAGSIAMQQFARRSQHERRSQTDTSMPDYVPPSDTGHKVRSGTDRMHTSYASHGEDESMTGFLKVPSNTPSNTRKGSSCQADGTSATTAPKGHGISPDLATSLTTSLLSQPPPTNLQGRTPSLAGQHLPNTDLGFNQIVNNAASSASDGSSSSSSPASLPHTKHIEVRKLSQQMFARTGEERQGNASGLSTSDSAASLSVQAEDGSSVASPAVEAVSTTVETTTTDTALTVSSGNVMERSGKQSVSAKIVEVTKEPEQVSPKRGQSPLPGDMFMEAGL